MNLPTVDSFRGGVEFEGFPLGNFSRDSTNLNNFGVSAFVFDCDYEQLLGLLGSHGRCFFVANAYLEVCRCIETVRLVVYEILEDAY